MLPRLLTSVLLFAVAAFCGFGYLATYEPPGSPLLRVVYAGVGLLGLASAVRLLLPRSQQSG